ncbi:hypothetical protein N9396_04285 [Candidatus Pelagibacter ubique]|nr:hypothetical protein [Candidatus Pelagibacter ubique]
MGLFDFFKTKKTKNSNSELVEETYDKVMTILQVQSSMITGSLAPKDSLPKHEWILGYIFGHTDSFLQVGKLKDDDDAWKLISLTVFRAYFGKEEGDEIFESIPDLLEKKLFIEGRKVGGQELHDFLKKGEKFAPMGMVSYLHKKYKKYKKNK